MKKGSHKHQFRWSLFLALLGGWALAFVRLVPVPYGDLCTKIAAVCYLVGMLLFLGAKMAEIREERATAKPVEAKPSN